MTRVNNRNLTTFACAIALSLGSLTASAGEGGLYAPIAPKGSTFVRAYNAGNTELNVSVGNTALSDVSPLGSTDFAFMPAGSYSAKVGSTTIPVKLDADHYYTLVNQPGIAPKLVEDPAFKNKQKALLRVQNLSDTNVTLRTADGKTKVVDSVAPSAHGEREVNPVKITLALFKGENKVSDLKPITLARGQVVSLYVTGSGNELLPNWVKRPAKTD